MTAPKYETTLGVEGEFQPGSRNRVLRNRLGIKSVQLIHEAEYRALLSAQHQYLEFVTEATTFNARFLCQMHRDWLGGIYEWAGTYRRVEMSKTGFTWPPAFRVPHNMERFENGLLTRWRPLESRTIEETCLIAAEIHAEFLLIHPFREGNGRIARWLTDLLCLQSGLPPLDYQFTGRGSRQRQAAYLQAVIQGYERNYRALAEVFRVALERSLAKGLGSRNPSNTDES